MFEGRKKRDFISLLFLCIHKSISCLANLIATKYSEKHSQDVYIIRNTTEVSGNSIPNSGIGVPY